VLFLVTFEDAPLRYYPPREELKSSVEIAIVEPRASSCEDIWVLTRARSKDQRYSKMPIGLE
jgi:hypothetical protein